MNNELKRIENLLFSFMIYEIFIYHHTILLLLTNRYILIINKYLVWILFEFSQSKRQYAIRFYVYYLNYYLLNINII